MIRVHCVLGEERFRSKTIRQPANEKEFTVSRVNGDKSRFHVKRKQKIAQRERNRELVKSLAVAHKAPAKVSSAKPKPVSA